MEVKVLEITELEYLKLTVVVDYFNEEGFEGNPAVSYFIETNKGNSLMDFGLGTSTSAFLNNVLKLNLSIDKIDEFIITHLHGDHMGGNDAMKNNLVNIPEILLLNNEDKKKRVVHVPQKCSSKSMIVNLVSKPSELSNGLVTTGPLARSMFFLGDVEEQTIFAKIKGKGLVIITGCGHPTVEMIVKIIQKIAPNEPIYAIIGGLHFPISKSRGKIWGIPFQQVLGTGKTFYRRITRKDLESTVMFLNSIEAKKLILSAHDTCDEAIDLMTKGLKAEVNVLSAGKTYTF